MKIRKMLHWHDWETGRGEEPICVDYPALLKKMVEKLEREGNDSL